MAELRITRTWVREWTDEHGTAPAHWIYRCVGEYETGRTYAIHQMITPEMAEDVDASVIEDVVREAWHAHLAETLRSGGPD